MWGSSSHQHKLEYAYGVDAQCSTSSQRLSEHSRRVEPSMVLRPLLWLVAALVLVWAVLGQWVVWIPYLSSQKIPRTDVLVEDVEISSDLFDYSTPHEQATDGLGGGEQLEAGETRLGTPVHTVDTTSMRAPDHLALVALVYHLPLFVLGLAGWVTRHWHNSNGRLWRWNEGIRAVFNRSVPSMPFLKGAPSTGVTYVEALVLLLALAPKAVYLSWFISESQKLWDSAAFEELGIPGHYSKGQFWAERIALWTGTDFLISAPFLFAFVARGSLVNSYLGVSFGTIIKWHRWVGTFSIFDVLVHGLMYQSVWISDSFNGWTERQFRFQYNYGLSSLSAFISWSACIVLLVTLTPWVRRGAFWIFYWSHIGASIIFVIFGIIHTHKVWKFFAAGLVLYGIDVGYRWLQASHDVTVFLTPGTSLTSVVIPIEEGIDYGDGGHIWVRLPQLGGKLGRQYHPFCVASSSADPAWRSCMLLHCKAYSRWTKNLLEGVTEGKLPHRMRAHVQGPFEGFVATEKESRSFGHLLVASGGIGVATVLPMLKRLALQMEDAKERGTFKANEWPKVTVYHTARTLDELALVAPLLPHARIFDLHLHLTQTFATALKHVEKDPACSVAFMASSSAALPPLGTPPQGAACAGKPRASLQAAAAAAVRSAACSAGPAGAAGTAEGCEESSTAQLISLSIPLPVPLECPTSKPAPTSQSAQLKPFTTPRKAPRSPSMPSFRTIQNRAPEAWLPMQSPKQLPSAFPTLPPALETERGHTGDNDYTTGDSYTSCGESNYRDKYHSHLSDGELDAMPSPPKAEDRRKRRLSKHTGDRDRHHSWDSSMLPPFRDTHECHACEPSEPEDNSYIHEGFVHNGPISDGSGYRWRTSELQFAPELPSDMHGTHAYDDDASPEHARVTRQHQRTPSSFFTRRSREQDRKVVQKTTSGTSSTFTQVRSSRRTSISPSPSPRSCLRRSPSPLASDAPHANMDPIEDTVTYSLFAMHATKRRSSTRDRTTRASQHLQAVQEASVFTENFEESFLPKGHQGHVRLRNPPFHAPSRMEHSILSDPLFDLPESFMRRQNAHAQYASEYESLLHPDHDLGNMHASWRDLSPVAATRSAPPAPSTRRERPKKGVTRNSYLRLSNHEDREQLKRQYRAKAARSKPRGVGEGRRSNSKLNSRAETERHRGFSRTSKRVKTNVGAVDSRHYRGSSFDMAPEDVSLLTSSPSAQSEVSVESDTSDPDDLDLLLCGRDKSGVDGSDARRGAHAAESAGLLMHERHGSRSEESHGGRQGGRGGGAVAKTPPLHASPVQTPLPFLPRQSSQPSPPASGSRGRRGSTYARSARTPESRPRSREPPHAAAAATAARHTSSGASSFYRGMLERPLSAASPATHSRRHNQTANEDSATLSRPLYISADGSGVTTSRQPPRPQALEESSSMHDCGGDSGPIKRAKGTSHKWESVLVWIGAWAGSFWFLILGDVHMQRLRRSAVEPLTEKQLNEFKQSRALIQVLACILTVLGFPIVLILLCRAVRAARRGGGGKLEQDTTQGLLEPSLRIGNIGNSSQFLASISQNYKSSGSIQRKLSAKPLSSDDVTPTLGYGRRGNQFASATFNTQSQSNKLMRLHEVLLDVVNGQNIQMRVPNSNAPPVTIHKGRPDLTKAVKSSYEESLAKAQPHLIIPDEYSDSWDLDENEDQFALQYSANGGSKKGVNGVRKRGGSQKVKVEKPAPVKIFAAGPKKMNNSVYQAVRDLPLNTHVGVAPMAYEL